MGLRDDEISSLQGVYSSFLVSRAIHGKGAGPRVGLLAPGRVFRTLGGRHSGSIA